VDLIKAFDTANHELLFKLLAKFGCPEPLIDVIRRLHASFFLEFTLDKKRKCLIPYGIGVRQGDNMGGLLFLFLMQAFHEVMVLEFEKSGRELPSVLSPLEDEILIRGQLTTQPSPERTTGQLTKVADTLFVDDGSFPFSSREELKDSLPSIKRTFSRFGLLMHVGELGLMEPWNHRRLKLFSFQPDLHNAMLRTLYPAESSLVNLSNSMSITPRLSSTWVATLFLLSQMNTRLTVD